MRRVYISRKDSIVMTAIEIVDELGIQGLTIRELSKRQNITDAAIYRHFKSKSDILLSVLDRFTHFDSMIRNTIIEQKYLSRDGILFYIKSYAEYYENYPAITSLLFVYDVRGCEAEVEKRIKQIRDSRSNFLDSIIREGQLKGEITAKFSSEELSTVIIGIIMEIILRWRINSCGFPLKDKLMETIEKLLTV